MKRFAAYFLLFLLLVVQGCHQPGTLQEKDIYASAREKGRMLMDSLLKQGWSPGMDIAVSLHGKTVWSEGFGFADLEHEVPVLAGITRFRIGSVSKPVTAAGLGILMQRGLVDVDRQVNDYVSYWPQKEYPLTIREIAGHTGGIRHYRNREYMMAKHFGSVEEGISIFSGDSLLFEPGTRFSYSSYGWNLVSAVIEEVSGEPFLSFMQHEVFDPLGMSSTCADKNDSIIIHRTSFYTVNEDTIFINAPYVDNSYKWAGGGFISTTTDLVKFGEAHMKPGFLDGDILKELTTSQVLSNGDSTGYGMGWFCGIDEGMRRISHGGGSIGGITDFVVYPEQELVIVVLSNSSLTRYGNVVSRIRDLFLEADTLHMK